MTLSFEDVGGKVKMKDILQKVSEEMIYQRFARDFPKQICKSPFRTDKTDSFGFYKKGGHWRWKDLGGNGDEGDVFDYVARLERTDVPGAIRLVADAFNIMAENSTASYRNYEYSSAGKTEDRQRKLIQVIPRPLDDFDKALWNKINIHPGIMNMYLIRATNEVWVNKKLVWEDKGDNPIYYYLSPITRNIKAYRPLETNKKRRWLSNQDPHFDIQGYHQCQIKRCPGRPLLLVKSLKEAAFFRTFGFNAMANTAEHTSFDMDFIRHIKKYCFPIIYLGDNDWPGLRAAVKIKQRYDIPPLAIPQKWGAKDPTDLWVHNYRKVYDLLNLIHDYIQTIRIAGPGAHPPRGLYYPREAQ